MCDISTLVFTFYFLQLLPWPPLLYPLDSPQYPPDLPECPPPLLYPLEPLECPPLLNPRDPPDPYPLLYPLDPPLLNPRDPPDPCPLLNPLDPLEYPPPLLYPPDILPPPLLLYLLEPPYPPLPLVRERANRAVKRMSLSCMLIGDSEFTPH